MELGHMQNDLRKHTHERQHAHTCPHSAHSLVLNSERERPRHRTASHRIRCRSIVQYLFCEHGFVVSALGELLRERREVRAARVQARLEILRARACVRGKRR